MKNEIKKIGLTVGIIGTRIAGFGVIGLGVVTTKLLSIGLTSMLLSHHSTLVADTINVDNENTYSIKNIDNVSNVKTTTITTTNITKINDKQVENKNKKSSKKETTTSKSDKVKIINYVDIGEYGTEVVNNGVLIIQSNKNKLPSNKKMSFTFNSCNGVFDEPLIPSNFSVLYLDTNNDKKPEYKLAIDNNYLDGENCENFVIQYKMEDINKTKINTKKLNDLYKVIRIKKSDLVALTNRTSTIKTIQLEIN